jgi:hypothetical protein
VPRIKGGGIVGELIKPWIVSADGRKAVNVDSGICLLVEESRAPQFDLVAFHLSNHSGTILLGTFTSVADATRRLQEYISATAH